MIASIRVNIKHSRMQLSRSITIHMRHIIYMLGKKDGILNWWLQRWFHVLSWWLHVHIFMLLFNTVYFFTLGASMWFYFRVSWKIQLYIQHVDIAWSKHEQFRICRDTFPLKTILSMVEFAENYTLQLQNEIQVSTITQRRWA